MIAGVVVENKKIKAMEIDNPTVGDNEVLVATHTTGICGSDIPRVWNNGAHSYPIILGHEFSGIVLQTGKNVKKVNEKDHIVGIPLIPCFECDDCKNGNFSLCKNYSFIGSRRNGSMSELISLPETNVFKIDKNIDLETAAFFEPSTVAIHAIRLTKINRDNNVLVLGGGNIGAFMIQWLKLLGINNITVLGRSIEKLNNCLKYGADNVVSTKNENYINQLTELTNGRGFDYIFETAGSAELMKLSFKLVANKGTVCLVGTPREQLTFSVRDWETINRKEMILTGSWMSYSNPWPGVEWELTEKHFKDGTLKIYPEMIDSRFELKDIDKAFELYKDGKKPNGKVLIKNSKNIF